jgi:menaquinone-9 beta-reductase
MAKIADALVIGGGPSGAALACLLARAGRPVLLVERKPKFHDKVCGDFLSAEVGAYLRDLGVDLPALGAAPIEAVRFCVRGRTTTTPLPFSAVSLSRRALDGAILDAATAAGVVVRRARATNLTWEAGAWRTRLENGEIESGSTAFLATGKQDLRDWRRPSGKQNDLIAFKMYLKLDAAQSAALDRHVEVIPFDGGYAGLLPAEGGAANLCLVVRRQVFLAKRRGWDELLSGLRSECPHLDRRLTGSAQLAERPFSIWPIPYGYVCAESEGVWRLGDQAAVVPSFCGDGVAIALHSARLAAHCYIARRSPAEFQARLAADVSGQIRFATRLSRILVRSTGQTAMVAAIRLFPNLLPAIAMRTRIAEFALRRTGCQISAPGASEKSRSQTWS